MTWTGSLPPTQPRLPKAYQQGSSIFPSSPLFFGLILLLMLFLLMMAIIFYAEGSRGLFWTFIVAFAVLAFGLWRLNRRKGV